jgi:PAS domain S-box-containing protein
MGFAADDIFGRHFSSFYTPEDRAAGMPQRALATALSEGKFEAEGWRLRKDGTRFWASVVIDPIRDETGALRGFAKVTRDITERRKAQQALDEAREALAQAQKMEAVGQLTGGVAHDFNNLLQAISSSLELIEQRLSDGRTDVAPFAATARAAVDRAATLTRRLLAFARRQPLKPERADLNMLVVGLWDLLGRSVGEEIRLERRLAEPLWPVHADVNQIESSLLNLVINARDAMPDGGSVTVETANASLRPADLANEPGVEPGDYAVLTVRDSGTGMPPDLLARVFEPFFTTKPIGQGTGLGLSQLYGFARQSGGFVRIDSAVGRGTAVHLHLPRDHAAAAEQAAPAPTPAPAAVPTPPTGRAGRGTVLVVEDEGLVRMLLVEVLEGDGYTVLEAADGTTALARLSEAAAGREGPRPQVDLLPPVDLLVTDVGLPGLNGRQLAEAAQAHYPDLKVLFLTGYAFQALDDRPGDGEDGLGRNMRMLAKPVAVDAFRAMVRSMLSDG